MRPHFKDWLLDISFHTEGEGDLIDPCFIPVSANGNICTGLSFLAETCPGNLVGVYHSGGQEKALEWIKKNQGLLEKYSKKEIGAKENNELPKP